MSQTISNIRQRILLTIISIDELRLICQESSHCCRASPLLQLGFLVLQANYCGTKCTVAHPTKILGGHGPLRRGPLNPRCSAPMNVQDALLSPRRQIVSIWSLLVINAGHCTSI